jgi:hypothetical protein
VKGLQIGEGLALPLEAVTQTFGILAVRGAGKTNLARVMAEEMYKAKLPFVAVDPVGSWWGLRSSRDGKAAGIEIPIFGGRHHDVPLERTGGALIADLVVGDRLSCILDVSEFSEGDKIRFLIDFAERLYRTNQDPLHLFLEEADDYCPQRPFREQARLLRSWENIVRRGRSRGLGVTMISQRSAALNKNVLTQIETLFVLRTMSPQDRKAIAAWVEFHGQAKELLASLDGLKNGEAWLWSPSWLRKCERILARLSWTFDSGATPKDDRGARPPANLADVDLGAIKSRVSETIERAKAEDPRELRKRIAELERELKARPTPEAKIERIEVPIVKDEHIQTIRKLAAFFDGLDAHFARLNLDVLPQARQVSNEIVSAMKRFGNGSDGPSFPARHALVPARERIRTAKRTDPSEHSGAALPLGQRRCLAAIAQHRAGVTRQQLTVLTGYRRSSRDTYLQRLQQEKLVELAGDSFIATAAGLEALGDGFEPLPTGKDLREHWLRHLPQGERVILELLTDCYPQAATREQLSQGTGYKRSSRDAYVQKLRSRGLIQITGAGELRASEELF